MTLAGCTESAPAPAPDAGTRDASEPGDATDAQAEHDGTVGDAALDASADASSDGGVQPDASAPGLLMAYVGSAEGEIHAFAVDRSTAALTARPALAAGPNPSFLAMAPSTRHLYAVNEASAGEVSAFAVDPSTGALASLGRVPAAGSGPAHLSVDPSGRWVLVASYGDGRVAVLRIAGDGTLDPNPADRERPGQNAHQIITGPSGTHVFVPCLGSNLVAQYDFDPANGQLLPNDVPERAITAGAGPRHLAFHPSGRWAYLMNEHHSSIDVFEHDTAAGVLSPLQTVSALPAGFRGDNTGAEIVVHPSGRFVFSSNRGHDSVASFAVDPQRGTLALLDHTPTGGSSPRSFALSPDGRWLMVANQRSDSIHAMQIDAATGALTAIGAVARVRRPAFVGLFELRR